jgi:rod shape determining protein RodA
MSGKLHIFDWQLLVPVFILIAISLLTLFSINVSFVKSQFMVLLVSLSAFFIFSNANLKIFKIYSIPMYFAAIVLLVLVFMIGIESRGSLRWIEIFGFRLQFSEILKPFLAIGLAAYISELKAYNFRSLLNIFILLSPVALLIFLQPDLGDALIYCLVVICLSLYLGFSFKYFGAILLPFLLIAPVFWNLLHDYQRQRVLTYLDPGKDPLGTSYNVIQSVIAVGSGTIFGKGIGLGTQSGLRFLPERHTDFIFATISEQLGFVGSVLVLICFSWLLYRIYKNFKNSDDRFTRIFAAIVFFAFLIQIFINVGMNIGILPIVGVTLPFVSYGGSSLLSNFIFLGLLSALVKSSKQTKVLEIK